MKPKCIVEGCFNVALHRPEKSPHATLCHKHYREVPRIRVWRYGNQKCSIEGCERLAKIRGLCQLHYQRLPTPVANRRRSYLARLNNPDASPCSIKGCLKKSFRKGLCVTHYSYECGSEFPNKYSPKSSLNKLPQKCQVCGYDRLRPHKHRVNPSIGYKLGNIVLLCSNCHREIHAGITDCPEPYTSIFTC